MKRFQMKNLGEAINILGMKICRNRKQGLLQVNQTNYIQDILKDYNIIKYKPAATPADPNQKLGNFMESKSKEDRRN